MYKLQCGHGERDGRIGRGGALVCKVCGAVRVKPPDVPALPELVERGEAARELARELLEVAEAIQQRLLVADCEGRRDDAAVFRISLQALRNMAVRRGGGPSPAKGGRPRLRVVGGGE